MRDASESTEITCSDIEAMGSSERHSSWVRSAVATMLSRDGWMDKAFCKVVSALQR